MNLDPTTGRKPIEPRWEPMDRIDLIKWIESQKPPIRPNCEWADELGWAIIIALCGIAAFLLTVL